ncbi:MAG: hypothetical protein ACLT2Z_02210 [Eubacterium sp.]
MTEKTEAKRLDAGFRLRNVEILGVSRSGYLAWLHHVPSDTEKRREVVKQNTGYL